MSAGVVIVDEPLEPADDDAAQRIGRILDKHFPEASALTKVDAVLELLAVIDDELDAALDDTLEEVPRD